MTGKWRMGRKEMGGKKEEGKDFYPHALLRMLAHVLTDLLLPVLRNVTYLSVLYLRQFHIRALSVGHFHFVVVF